MKKIFTFFASLITLLFITSCSSVFEPNGKFTNIKVSCPIPAARLTISENTASGLIEAYKKNNPVTGNAEITLQITGKDYSYSQTLKMENAIKKAILNIAETADNENEISNKLNKLSIPAEFNLTDIPAGKELTFSAILTTTNEQGKKIICKGTETVTLKEGSNNVTIKVHEIDSSSYDRNALLQSKLQQINTAASNAQIFTIKKEDSDNTYTLKSFFNAFNDQKIEITQESILLNVEEDISLSETIKIKDITYSDKNEATSYTFYINLNGHNVTVSSLNITGTATTQSFSITSSGSTFIYNGTVTINSNLNTSTNYGFLENTNGTVTLTGVNFESFNQRVVNQFGAGLTNIDYCTFNKCYLNSNTGGLITMYQDTSISDSSKNSGAVTITGTRFNDCCVYNHSLIRAKGNITLNDVIASIDISKAVSQEGYKSTNESNTMTSTFISSKEYTTLNFSGVKIDVTNNDIKSPAIYITDHSDITFKTAEKNTSEYVNNIINSGMNDSTKYLHADSTCTVEGSDTVTIE